MSCSPWHWQYPHIDLDPESDTDSNSEHQPHPQLDPESYSELDMQCQLEPNFNFHPPKYDLSYPDIHPFTDPLQLRHSLIMILTLRLISNLNWFFFFLNWILNLTLDLKFPSHWSCPWNWFQWHDPDLSLILTLNLTYNFTSNWTLTPISDLHQSVPDLTLILWP